MINCNYIKSIFKSKVRLTESFLVFFLITGSISYGEVIPEDEVREDIKISNINNQESSGIGLSVSEPLINYGLISGELSQKTDNKTSESTSSDAKNSGIGIEISSDNLTLKNLGVISGSLIQNSGDITNANHGNSAGSSSSVSGNAINKSIIDPTTTSSLNVDTIKNYGLIKGNVMSTCGNIISVNDDSSGKNYYIGGSTHESGNGINLSVTENRLGFIIKNDLILSNVNNSGVISGVAIKNPGNIETLNRGTAYYSTGFVNSGNGINLSVKNSKNSSNVENNIILKEINNNGIISGNFQIDMGVYGGNGLAGSSWGKHSGNGINLSGGITLAIENLNNIGEISGFFYQNGIKTIKENFNDPNNVYIQIEAGSGNGINLYTSKKATITNIQNNGLIRGEVFQKASSTIDTDEIIGEVWTGTGSGNGINMTGFTEDSALEGLINVGTISGVVKRIHGIVFGDESSYSGSGLSIYKHVNDFKNLGVIKGSQNAIVSSSVSGNNYGVLAGQNIVFAGSKDNYTNFGTEVEINEDSTIKKVNVGDSGTITLDGYSDVYTILNGTDIGETATEKKEYAGNTYISSSNLTSKKNIIINGAGVNKGALDVVNETTIEKGIINGYETALTINGDNKFTGTDVTFNGGGLGEFNEKTKKFDYKAVIKGDEGDNTLNILGNSIINGKVDLGAGDDSLLVSNGTQINGDMDGGAGTDTLRLGDGVLNMEHPLNNHDGNNDGKIDKGDWRGLAIYHEIKDFENIDITGAVTLYETAKITGESKIHLGKDSSLNLRIDSTKKDDSGRIIGHALYTAGKKVITAESHTETITEYESKGGGTLNLITNGIGVGGVIAMSELKQARASLENIGTTTLDPNKKNLYIRTDSIIHSATVHTEESPVVLSIGPTPQVGDIKITVNQDLLVVTPKPIDPEPPVNPIEPPVNKYQPRYTQLNRIYKSLIADGDNINAIYPTTSITLLKQYLDYPVQSDVTDMALGNLLALLNEIYTASPYSFSSELSRESMGLYSDAIVDNPFKAKEKEWMVYGGLLHESADLKDRYYGKNYHGFDTTDKTTNVKVDNKITGAYALAEYGIDTTLSVGGILGGSKNKSDASNGSKLDGNSFYIGGYAKKDIDEFRVIGGLGYQYTDYNAKRVAGNMMQSFSYDNDYNDNGLNIYLSGRYHYALGNDYYLVPKAKLSYTHINQDGVNEGDRPLAMDINSKSFDVFEGLIGVDLKKEFLHTNGKSALKAGVAYKRILSGYEDGYLTANMKNGSDFDLLVPNKVKNNYIVGIGYEYENQKGVLFNINGSYSFDVKESNSVRDNSGTKNSATSWTVGLGIGYRFK